jgi:cyanophycinase
MSSNFLEIEEREQLELINVKLHLLPGGARYYLHRHGDQQVPEALREAVAAVTSVSTVSQPVTS